MNWGEGAIIRVDQWHGRERGGDGGAGRRRRRPVRMDFGFGKQSPGTNPWDGFLGEVSSWGKTIGANLDDFVDDTEDLLGRAVHPIFTLFQDPTAAKLLRHAACRMLNPQLGRAMSTWHSVITAEAMQRVVEAISRVKSLPMQEALLRWASEAAARHRIESLMRLFRRAHLTCTSDVHASIARIGRVHICTSSPPPPDPVTLTSTPTPALTSTQNPGPLHPGGLGASTARLKSLERLCRGWAAWRRMMLLSTAWAATWRWRRMVAQRRERIVQITSLAHVHLARRQRVELASAWRCWHVWHRRQLVDEACLISPSRRLAWLQQSVESRWLERELWLGELNELEDLSEDEDVVLEDVLEDALLDDLSRGVNAQQVAAALREDSSRAAATGTAACSCSSGPLETNHGAPTSPVKEEGVKGEADSSRGSSAKASPAQSTRPSEESLLTPPPRPPSPAPPTPTPAARGGIKSAPAVLSRSLSVVRRPLSHVRKALSLTPTPHRSSNRAALERSAAVDDFLMRV